MCYLVLELAFLDIEVLGDSLLMVTENSDLSVRVVVELKFLVEVELRNILLVQFCVTRV